MSVRPSVCRVPRSNSRPERPRKLKIGMLEAHHTSNSRAFLEVKRSKVNVTRPINAVTDNALANTPRVAKRDGCCIWRLDDDLAPLLRHVDGITVFLKLACRLNV